MPASGQIVKRLLVGRAMRSDRLGETLLPKRLALPIFASDALSSVAYAPDEILLMLGVAGGSFAALHSWQVTLGVVFVMVVVVASYRQNVHAYPSGGGDYEVATENLGHKAGLTVASALLVDYVLTVAVSISSGVQNAAAALPQLRGHEVMVALALVFLLAAMNLRGVRESGRAFAVPVYAFMAAIIGMGLYGVYREVTGTLGRAPSAGLELVPAEGQALTGIAATFILLRAFSSGCAALTGVEAISNGVPAFRKPKSANAAATLLLMGTISVCMLSSIIALSNWTGVQMGGEGYGQLVKDGHPVGEEYVQDTVIGQLAKTVFSDFPVGIYVVATVTGIILILAANTAFNGFPVLGSILAKDGYLPRQLHTRGDRLAFSNGILILAVAAAALIVVYQAEVTQLIQLYIVGVFVSFSMSQTGMIRHWNRLLRDPGVQGAERSRMVRSRAVNLVGAAMSMTVLLVVLITKFQAGAKYAILAMAVLFAMMLGINRHYRKVSAELSLAPDSVAVLPSRVHAIVLVSKLHKPALRAVAYARATRPSTLEALTVEVDSEDTRALRRDWVDHEVPIPLKIVASPYREITRPVIDYVKALRSDHPRTVVIVYVPEYVVGHWYEQILHNQSALRLRVRLHFIPGVMVASVPWQLRSSEGAEEEWYDAPAITTRAGNIAP